MIDLGIDKYLINWIIDFLTDRLMTVKYYTNFSKPYSNISGVPQGSRLSSLLFIIFFNAVPDLLHNLSLLFADDITFFRVIKDRSDSCILQSDIDIQYSWSNVNKLDRNISKCKIMTFSRQKNPIVCDYTINGISLERVDAMNDLGVLYCSNFTFDAHVDMIAKGALRTLSFIKRITRLFNSPASILML